MFSLTTCNIDEKAGSYSRSTNFSKCNFYNFAKTRKNMDDIANQPVPSTVSLINRRDILRLEQSESRNPFQKSINFTFSLDEYLVA